MLHFAGEVRAAVYVSPRARAGGGGALCVGSSFLCAFVLIRIRCWWRCETRSDILLLILFYSSYLIFCFVEYLHTLSIGSVDVICR